MKTVFLGGTCNNSLWREQLIPLLNINYFNPVVNNWTPECQAEEIRQRAGCDCVLYVITPRMTGVYSIAEVVEDSNKRPSKTIFCALPDDGELSFNSDQLKSLLMVTAMVKNNGAKVCDTLAEVAEFLNNEGK